MRYLPHTDAEIAAMLAATGVRGLEDFFRHIPDQVRREKNINLPETMTEWELEAELAALAGGTATGYNVFLGAGRYQHHVPAAISYLLGRSEFTTAYTPYQPEISQGTLQAIFEYQSLVCRLLGMEVANASMYDGASALAEAMLMTLRLAKKSDTVAISRAVHPFFRQVVATYFGPTQFKVIELPLLPDGSTDFSPIAGIKDLAGVAVQSPNFFGIIENLAQAAQAAHDQGAYLVAAFTEPLAYGLLKNPGSCGADIACGEGQSFGLPMAYGGPGLGIMTSKMEYVRNIPGRLIGQTLDQDGRRGFVLTLATREQHIRREKAVSNICTNSGLCALTAAMYLASLGGPGLRELAGINHDKAEYLKQALVTAGCSLPLAGPTFNEFVVKFPNGFDLTSLKNKKIIPGLPLEPYYPELAGHYLVCVTETKTKADLDALVKEVQS